MALSCTTCKGFEPIVDARGQVTKGFCHGRCPMPQMMPNSNGDGNEVVMVFGTIYLPNFCLEHVEDVKMPPAPPASVTP